MSTRIHAHLGEQQLIRGRVLAQTMLIRGARVHERLSNHTQTRVHCDGFVDVEYKVWIFDEIHPKPQWQTENRER